DEAKKERLATVMNFLVQSLYKVAILTAPYMPTASQKIWNQLGVTTNILEVNLDSVNGWDLFSEGHILGTAEPIFPRLEVEKKEVKKDPLAINEDLKIENPIEIADFDKIDIQVVEILEVSNIEGADKLLKFKVKTANEVRQIVSGIAQYYPTPAELIGKKVLAILNLPPVNLRGVLSQGMLLSSTEKKRLKLVEVDSTVKVGAKIK
ncbi:MAG: methionine--tRNA ligase, partial [Cetobacterium sp.]